MPKIDRNKIIHVNKNAILSSNRTPHSIEVIWDSGDPELDDRIPEAHYVFLYVVFSIWRMG